MNLLHQGAVVLAVLLVLLTPPACGQTRSGSANAKLNRVISKIELEDSTVEAALSLAAKTSEVSFMIDWSTLVEAGVEKGQRFSLKATNLKVHQLLDLVCRLAGGKEPIDWAVSENVVRISSTAQIDSKQEFRKYSIRGINVGVKRSGPNAVAQVATLIGSVLPQLQLQVVGQQVQANGSARDHQQLERLLLLCRRGMKPADWKALVQPLEVLKKCKVDFVFTEAKLTEVLAAISEKASIPVALEHGAVEKPEAKVNLTLKQTGADKALDLVLKSLGGGRRGLVADPVGGAIIVTTPERAARHLVALTVSPMALRKAGVTTAEDLIAVIKQNIAQDSWQQGAQLAVVGGNRLICLQTVPNLIKVARLVKDRNAR